MARRWTVQEERIYRKELLKLYVHENKSIGEIGNILHLGESTVFQRLQRLNIPTAPKRKLGYLRRRNDVVLPTERSCDLAEFFGIMIGDGHVSHFQTIVTLGTKELAYVTYVRILMEKIFAVPATICVRKDGYRDVYIGSVVITRWLHNEGLVTNKVAAQVGAPQWIFSENRFMTAFLRGFFDTDGSVYKLRYGIQLSFTNKSTPLLLALQAMLRRLGYRVSELSANCVYITKQDDVERFFAEIQPMNTKHTVRYQNFTRR